jgi:hypothetical protein
MKSRRIFDRLAFGPPPFATFDTTVGFVPVEPGIRISSRRSDFTPYYQHQRSLAERASRLMSHWINIGNQHGPLEITVLWSRGGGWRHWSWRRSHRLMHYWHWQIDIAIGPLLLKLSW